MTSKNGRHIAEHEAAHAAAAWAAGARLIAATVWSSPGMNDEPCCKLDYPRNPDGTVDLQKMLIIDGAPAALTGDPTETRDIFDFMQFSTWNGAFQIAAEADQALRAHPDNPARATEIFFRKYKDEITARLGDAPGAVIPALADLLEKNGRLSGFEMAKFLQERWPGPLPPDALPPGDHLDGLLPNPSAAEARQAAWPLIEMALDRLRIHEENDPLAGILKAAVSKMID